MGPPVVVVVADQVAAAVVADQTVGTESVVVVDGTAVEAVGGTLKRRERTAFENGENYFGTLMSLMGLW